MHHTFFKQPPINEPINADKVIKLRLSFSQATAFILILFFGISLKAYSQFSPNDPDSVLVGNRKQPTVFLVGTFHFAYYNFDAHKTSKENQVDILSEKKQNELQELLNYIYKFRPTKIAVESGPITGYLMTRRQAIKKGERKLGKDEIEQIGFRLLDEFDLDTLYGINDQGVYGDLYDCKDSLTLRPILDSISKGFDYQSNDTISNLYKNFYKENDSLAKSLSLLKYFKYRNSDKVLNRGFGAYLNGDFKLDNKRGADMMAMEWYSRNLRIYRHIQQITTSPNDRILVLIGWGHVTVLKHLFECSPEYKLVKFNDLK